MTYLLSIAGHDPIHGAGITADLAVWAHMGFDGASVVTALTTQNSHGLSDIAPVSSAMLQKNLQVVVADGEPAAIKIGMLGNAAIAAEVAQFLVARRCPVVFDPVLASSNAHPVFESGELGALYRLMQHVDVITPNVLEAQALLPTLLPAQPVSLSALRALCRQAVVLKGGHTPGLQSVDWVQSADHTVALSNPRWPGSVHGTGCVYASALAAGLAQGWGVFDAATQAKLQVHAGIVQARTRPGRPQVNTQAQLSSDHLPTLAHGEHLAPAMAPFAPLHQPPGFYPVVPSAQWVADVLRWGARTVQLRIKTGTLSPSALREQIALAIEAGARYPQAQVFINDHWQAALELGAYGVHLGQEDLVAANLQALQQAGLRLGISSHTPAEMAFAHAHAPSYVALGPVFPTTLKAMHYDTIGLARLAHWTRWYHPRYPVVAIGGITLAQAPHVWGCGVDGVAVVSAVTKALDPERATKALLDMSPLCI